jgi:endonuclease G
MNIQQLTVQRDRLSDLAARRYRDRSSKREEKLRVVEEKGVLAAAGAEAAVRRTAHMTRSEGRALLERKTLEALVGTDDSDSVSFLPRGEMAARPVCRLLYEGQPIGTGFLVAPGLLLTNNHVIGTAADAAKFVAEFDYEYTTDDQLRQPIARFPLEPDRLFATSDAESGLDFTFVAVQPTSQDNLQRIAAFGWLPMDPQRDKILEGEPAVIIQHPRGEPKRLCLFSAELVDRVDDFIQYTTDTDAGASGSPVFNRNWQLIGLHHAATTSDRRHRGHPVTVNEGIRVSSMIALLQAGGPKVNGSPESIAGILARVTAPEAVADGRPQGPRAAISAASARGNGGARITDESRLRTLETSIRTHDADHFRQRDSRDQGYKPNFIGTRELAIPLPKLPTLLERDAARFADGSGEFELTYMHFSAILSTSRRLPIITAANIDGPTSRKLARTDRDFEAADIWYFDGRVPRDLQLGPQVYDRTAFDFGHMVRREDPVWGDLDTARMANDDTFHMTNCVPQHHDLNTKTWLALENAVLASAREHQLKVSVFTGPVLSPADPVVLGVPVPTAFWKIVAYPDNGRLRAHGFMQSQTTLVEQVRSQLEALGQLDRVVEYQVPIREIARLTSIDFGPLVSADEMETTPERGRGGRRRLDESLIASIFPRDGGKPEPASGRPGPPADDAELLRSLAETLQQLAQVLARRSEPGR